MYRACVRGRVSVCTAIRAKLHANLLRVLQCGVSVVTVLTSRIRLVHSLIDLHKLLHQADLLSQHVI